MPLLDLIKNAYHYFLAFISALFYGFPSRKLKVIGITGTKGKSTVVELATRILEEAGYRVAFLSSIKIKIAGREEKNLFKMTMPGRGYVQKFLKMAVLAGCDYAIIEVTSEGILQHRQKFIDFEAAVFTNLSPEHIERHGSFENYRAAKGRFFGGVEKIHILNLDDKNSDYFLQFPAEKKWGYTSNLKSQISNLKNKNENLKILEIQDYEILSNGSKFLIDNFEFNLRLFGKFNIYNSLAAICVGLSQGVNLETCRDALEKVAGIPGRMEIVAKEPFKVIVDYAHTPDALESVYRTLANIHELSTNNTNNYSKRSRTIREVSDQIRDNSRNRLICVLGSAGGGRDKWKRPKMGEIAARYCDKIILTDEDPYDEDPMEIIEQVEKGTENISVVQRTHQRSSASIYKILDRRQAIKKTLELANPGDTVIITGKGCEPWMCVAGGKKIPWDDREIVREEFQKLKN